MATWQYVVRVSIVKHEQVDNGRSDVLRSNAVRFPISMGSVAENFATQLYDGLSYLCNMMNALINRQTRS